MWKEQKKTSYFRKQKGSAFLIGFENISLQRRRSGELEDSFIQRIFGGMTQSTVKTKGKESAAWLHLRAASSLAQIAYVRSFFQN